MKTKTIIYLFFSLFLLACSDTKDKEVSVSIPPEKMQHIFTDIAKAERMTMDNNLSEQERGQLMQEYKQSILKHYNVSPELYEKDMQIYLDNPKLMQKLTR